MTSRDTRTAVVTGAAGFVGTHCARSLATAGWRVVGVDRILPSGGAGGLSLYSSFLQDDLQDRAPLAAMLAQEEPVALIHAAGPASVEASFKSPAVDYHAQTGPLVTVLEALRITGAQTHAVLCSSAAVYGNPVSLPVEECALQNPISPYGFHKAAKEALVREYCDLFGVKASISRIFSVFGPGQRQLAVFDITRRMLAGDFSIFGTGQETRDYLYIDDAADALRTIAEKGAGNGEAINVASGEEMSIRDLAMSIAAILNLPQKAVAVQEGEAKGKPGRWRADTGRLAGLGFTPQVGIDEGLRRTVEWIRGQ